MNPVVSSFEEKSEARTANRCPVSRGERQVGPAVQGELCVAGSSDSDSPSEGKTMCQP